MFPAYHPQAEYDPRVASRIAAGEPSRAADYIQLSRDRAEIIAEATELMAPFDALIYPTVPMPAPTIEAAGASDSAYVALNLKLLRNPGLVSALDGPPSLPALTLTPSPDP